MDPLRNPKDPLHKTGPEAEKILFKDMVETANGFPLETVASSAVNVLINAIRQMCSTQTEAETKFDEMFLKAKTVLLDNHYDNLGNRRNVFPFHQVIEVPHIDFSTEVKF